jgi:TPR repeat protein
MYLSGTYLVEDYKKAFDLSKTACDHGASLGCKNLGYIFEIGGGGISVDYTQSRSYYQKRCDAEPKDKESCYAITRLKSASNPPFDLQALRLLTEGCDGNNKDDCNTLGTIYESGKPNVTQDSNQALLLFSQACKLGSAAGCSDLGDLYHHGHGVPTNLDLAFKFLQKGCDMGNSWACGEAKALQ